MLTTPIDLNLEDEGLDDPFSEQVIDGDYMPYPNRLVCFDCIFTLSYTFFS